MDVRIHQIYYRDDQRRLLDPAFIPYDNTANPRPEWREYYVFREEFFRGSCREDAITGYVSWKFRAKTKTKGALFTKFIRSNPGYDAYFFNPPGLVRERFRNVWLQGEHHHPGLIEITEAVFAYAGFPLRLSELCHEKGQALYCNYWAGTAAFWRKYMTFCEKVYDTIETVLPAQLKHRIDRRADVAIDACYRPFIMERMFTTLLAIDPMIQSTGFVARYCPLSKFFKRLCRVEL